MSPTADQSRFDALLRCLLAALGPVAARLALKVALEECSPLELAGFLSAWPIFARPKQLLPAGNWRSCLFQTGRGWGKTASAVSFALDQIEHNPTIRHVALVGPTDDQCVAVLVTGATGLLALCPPWLGCEFEPSKLQLRFGNGVVASIYSAQTPSRLRGPQHQLALNTELAYWADTTRDKTFENMELSTRTGSGRYLVDTTPADANPLIERLRAQHAADPGHHLLIEGSTEENEINLAPGIVKEWRRKLAGTDLEATDLDGTYRTESPMNMFKRESVERALRGGLERYERRIISIDPSTAGKRHSDPIGIVELALAGGQVYVLSSKGGRLDINEWPDMVLDHYAVSLCDVLAIECDHGSTAWPKIFSDACKLRGWQFRSVENASAPEVYHQPRQLNFHPFFVGNKRSKADRGRAAAAWVDKGRVSLVRGALGNLEAQMYGFTGADNRPDDAVDALVNGIMILGIADEAPDRGGEFGALGEMQKQLTGQSARADQTVNVAGHTVRYDGSAGMRSLFTAGGGGGYGLRGDKI
jgi:phage terminase large subunit-like protein